MSTTVGTLAGNYLPSTGEVHPHAGELGADVKLSSDLFVSQVGSGGSLGCRIWYQQLTSQPGSFFFLVLVETPAAIAGQDYFTERMLQHDVRHFMADAVTSTHQQVIVIVEDEHAATYGNQRSRESVSPSGHKVASRVTSSVLLTKIAELVNRYPVLLGQEIRIKLHVCV
jgi:hypothetical protein